MKEWCSPTCEADPVLLDQLYKSLRLPDVLGDARGPQLSREAGAVEEPGQVSKSRTHVKDALAVQSDPLDERWQRGYQRAVRVQHALRVTGRPRREDQK